MRARSPFPRTHRRLLTALVPTVVLVACQDSPPTAVTTVAPSAASFAVGDAANSTPIPGKLIVCKAGNIGGDFTATRTAGSGSFDEDGFTLASGSCVVVGEDNSPQGFGSVFQVHETGAPGVTFGVTAAAIEVGFPAMDLGTVSDGADFFINSIHGIRLTYANTFTDPCVVTSTGDAGAGSLRAAIADHSCSTITFDLVLPATITLTSASLNISDAKSIVGPGADKLTIARSSADGTPEFRIFSVSASANISGVTITNGHTSDDGGGIRISVGGFLTLSRSAVIGNAAGADGGGILNDNGAGLITRSLIANNSAGDAGGGISVRMSLAVEHSTVSGNRAVTEGGGIHNAGFDGVRVSHSTIVDNVVEAPDGRGGGIAVNTTSGSTTVRSSVVAGNSATEGPDLKVTGREVLTVTYSLIGSPQGSSVTSTPTNHNLIGTAETPLDPKLDGLALNAPGTTMTHALLEGSPAIDAGVCTDLVGNTVTDDQRGFTRPSGGTCDMGAYELEILTSPTTTELSISPSTQQYSDKVTLSASTFPVAAPGSIQFKKSIDGGLTFVDLGIPVAVPGASITDHQILESAGTDVRFKAVFTPTGNYTGSTSDVKSLTVTKESATVIYASTNVAALQVAAPGGTLAANSLTLNLAIKETSPDLAAATAGLGSIANAGLKVTLAPVGPGSSYDLTCTAGTVTGSGYAAARPFTCKNSGAVVVNTYEVVATVMGDYYTGTYSDAFTVFDPSLGFATGGGSFVLGGDKVNFGFTMKYGKNGGDMKGNFIAVRHHGDGTVSRLKSNALGELALGEDATVPMGWATFNGKATYTKWDATAGAYVTLGNQSFAVYAEDRDNPGTGIDRIWLGAPGTLAMPGTLATAKANTAVLTGGGIAVPHKAAGGGGKK